MCVLLMKLNVVVVGVGAAIAESTARTNSKINEIKLHCVDRIIASMCVSPNV